MKWSVMPIWQEGMKLDAHVDVFEGFTTRSIAVLLVDGKGFFLYLSVLILKGNVIIFIKYQ